MTPADLRRDVEKFHHALARRTGDFTYLSGIVAANGGTESMDAIELDPDAGPVEIKATAFTPPG
ncbi:hypothetical protein D3C87_2095310 [compost metagenome]